jgi:hypothetical protein
LIVYIYIITRKRKVRLTLGILIITI